MLRNFTACSCHTDSCDTLSSFIQLKGQKRPPCAYCRVNERRDQDEYCSDACALRANPIDSLCSLSGTASSVSTTSMDGVRSSICGSDE